MCSFWISSMVPIVRVLLLANAKLYGGGKKTPPNLMSNGAYKVSGTARTSLSSTPLKTADPRIPSADPIAESRPPPPRVTQGKVQAHLSGYPSELRGHM